MKFNETTIVQGAASFINSRHPTVLLAIPGLNVFGVSRANPKYQTLKFQDAPHLVIHTPEEFVARVQSISTEKKKGEGSNLADGYSNLSAPMIALRPMDSLYGRSLEKYHFYEGKLLGSNGWQFNLDPFENNTPTRRVYRITHTHLRFIAEGQPSSGQEGNTLISSARFVESKYLRMVVEGLVKNGPLSARVEAREGSTILPVIINTVAEIPAKYLTEYTIVDEALKRAFHQPKQTEKLFGQAAAALLQKGKTTQPVLEMMESLLRQPLGSPPFFEPSIRENISNISMRLWDGPLAAAPIGSRLENALHKFVSSSQIDSLSWSARADIAETTTSIEKLEAFDVFLWHDGPLVPITTSQARGEARPESRL